MMKFTCFIDASSYVNLTQDDYYINGKSLLLLLSEKVNIRFCNEVNREISRHSNSIMPSVDKRMSKVYKLKGYKRINTYKEYENRLYDSVSNSGDKNRGERHNLAASLDFHLSKKGMTGGLIFLTDDKKALNGLLQEVLNSFPVWKIWSSLDVILFLYLENKHFTIDMAQSAIKDINAILPKGSSKMTRDKITQERIRVLKEYLIRLNRVQKIMVSTLN